MAFLTNWWNAQTVAERAQRKGCIGVAESSVGRLSDWTDTPPFDDPEILQRRVAADGLDLEGFRAALCLSASAEVERPRWVDDLDRIMSARAGASQAQGPWPESPFLALVGPLIANAQNSAEAALAAFLPVASDPLLSSAQIVQHFSPKLQRALLERLTRVVVLEMHAARLRGELTAASPGARYREFVASLRPRAQTVLNKYPVLARSLWAACHDWVQAVRLFTRDLCSDWEALANNFNDGLPLGPLVDLQDSGSDPHDGGRSVSVLRFGSGRSIVYKPRSLAVDGHFRELLEWVNLRLGTAYFATIETMDCGDHGWAEYVAHRECGDDTYFSAFFERIGGYLAIFYILGSTDIHFENLIADGCVPYVVDLETVLHPDPGGLQASPSANHRMYSDSVLRIGLLPRWTVSGDASSAIDLGGLSGAGTGVWPDPIAQWRNFENDDMRIDRGPASVVRNVSNLPSRGGLTANPSDFVDEIKTGFRRVYNLLCDFRDALLAPGGPIEAFARDETRVVLRSTRTYQTLVQESFHPELLMDGLERERFLDLLLWKEVRQAPFLKTLIPAEKALIWNADVPRFVAEPGSRHLKAAASRWTFREFFPSTALEDIRQRAQSMGPLDREMQCDFITAAFSAWKGGDDRPPPPEVVTSYGVVATRAERVKERARAAVRHVAEHLFAQAHHESGGVGWYGPTVFASGQIAFQPLHWPLYDGLPGVALFLAYAGAELNDQRFTSLARESIDSLVHRLPLYATRIDSAGAYDGWCGIIYALTQLGGLWDDSSLSELCDSMISEALKYQTGHSTDIISGHAGAIASFLALYEAVGSQRAIKAAEAFGRNLADRLAGLAFVQPGAAGNVQPLAQFGFAHGFQGLIWSLLKLGHATGDRTFTATAFSTLDTCNRRMKIDPGTRRSAAWCNGLGGIGLAWLDISNTSAGVPLQAQRDLVLELISKAPTQTNHSLCHGESGSLELIARMEQAGLARHSRDGFLSRLEAVAEATLSGQAICGTHRGQASPGLMTGLSGVGMGLLRAVAPERVPNVLLLSGPSI